MTHLLAHPAERKGSHTLRLLVEVSINETAVTRQYREKIHSRAGQIKSEIRG
jgi:hypothetical protein